MDELKRSKTSSFIGYTRNKDLNTEELKKNISWIMDVLYEKGYRIFMISPFSLVEEITAQEVLKKKSIFPDIKVVVLKNDFIKIDLPALYCQCDELIDVNECLHIKAGDIRRNNYNYLVDNSSALMCYIDGKPKKRLYAIERAIHRNMEIINLYPFKH